MKGNNSLLFFKMIKKIKGFFKKKKPIEEETIIPQAEAIARNETVILDNTTIQQIIDNAAKQIYEAKEKELIKITVNNTMNILDGLINSTVDSKIRHSLRIAKLRIYESNFGRKESGDKKPAAK